MEVTSYTTDKNGAVAFRGSCVNLINADEVYRYAVDEYEVLRDKLKLEGDNAQVRTNVTFSITEKPTTVTINHYIF